MYVNTLNMVQPENVEHAYIYTYTYIATYIFATIDTCHVSHWNLEALQPGRVTVPQRQVEGNCVRERVREMSRFTGNALNKHSVVFLVAPATKQNPPCIRKCLGQIAVSVSG